MDYKKNEKYFETIHYKGKIFFIVVGIILIYIGIETLAIVSLIGFFLLALSIILIVIKKKSIVTDAEYDASVGSVLNNMQAKALEAVGIDEDEIREIAPVSFQGYVYNGATQFKKGKDGLWRTNKYEYVIIFFCENELHYYRYSFNTTSSNNTNNEFVGYGNTGVYFYNDIVTIKIQAEPVHILDQCITCEFVQLITVAGTEFSVAFRDDGTAKRSINAMRALIIAKKRENH